MNMRVLMATAAAGALLVAGAVSAATVGNVTSNVIYGSGNANGGFTIATNGALELGLRAHVRYDLSGQPQNVFNYNSTTNTYEFDPANSNAPANRSIFNFDWSINTDTADLDGSPDQTISNYTYELGVDTNPGLGTSYMTLDPYASIYDHSFGYNSTAMNAGLEAPGGGTFASLASTYNVSQQSWNMGFGFLGSPQTPGLYNFYLKAFDDHGDLAANTSIRVWVGAGVAPVPLPAGLPLLLGAFGGLAMLRRKRRNVA